jgi:hypothetical protein
VLVRLLRRGELHLRLPGRPKQPAGWLPLRRDLQLRPELRLPPGSHLHVTVPESMMTGTVALTLSYQERVMPYVIGAVLSMGVASFARLVGLDRDRAFYPTVLIVVASYYVLFAATGGSLQTVLLESAVMLGFVVAAVVGFKASTWVVVGALAAHGVFDVVHGRVLDNPGVPPSWPAFCLTYDIGAAVCLAWLYTRRRGVVRGQAPVRGL